MSEGTDIACRYESVIISSEYYPEGMELADTIVEIEMQERLFQPFLFGKLQFIDSMRVMEVFHGVLGGEKLEITLTRGQTDRYKDSVPFTQKFRITNSTSYKSSDQFQVVEFQFISEHMFISELKNVNKHYQGKPSEIIEKICTEFLDLEVDSDNSDRDEISVIVPNLSPVAAIDWIRKSAMTERGYPLACFFSPYFDKLIIRDVGFLLEQAAGNFGQPFSASTATGSSTGAHQADRGLKSYQHSVSTNISKLINRGVVGAEYHYLHTNSTPEEYHYHVRNDFTKPAYQDKIIGHNRDDAFIYNPFLELDNELIEELSANHYYYFGGANSYRQTDDEYFDLGYMERRNAADYKLHRTSEILTELIGMETLNYTIDGVEYMQGEKPTTVGNSMEIRFPRTSEYDVGDLDDIAKTGTYFMLGVRHMFKREGYDMVVQSGRMTRQESPE